MHLCIHRQLYQYIEGRKSGNSDRGDPGSGTSSCMYPDRIYELVGKVSSKNLPAIAYISFIAIFMTIPGVSPIAEYAIEQVGKIGLLPLCTPILAYAGISIGKDMDTFKEQGLAIVIVAIFTFAGTFLGSTIIAQIILKMTGVI